MLKTNRAYTMLAAFVILGAALAAIGLLTSSPNLKWILEWYGTLGLTVVMPIVGFKEGGKAVKSFAERQKSPPS